MDARQHVSLPIIESESKAAIDPVCGMSVDKSTAKHTLNLDGETYYFCSRSCLEKFSANPAIFIGQPRNESCCAGHKQETSLEAPEDAFYTCPMHPEVRQKGPGNCPKCGMALEPEAPTVPAERIEYTCPMHPEIVRPEPGFCPICGMALEPRTVAAVETNPELIDMTRRFWVSAALTAAAFRARHVADVLFRRAPRMAAEPGTFVC